MELNKIYNENCLDTMSRMPDNFIDLVVTSPPYNKGYWSANRNINNYGDFKTKARRIDYENFDDNLSPNDYVKWQKNVLNELIRVLKPSGSIFYNHQPIQKNHQEINPLYIYEYPLKQTIIWNRRNTPKLDKSYFFPITEYLFWVQKDNKARVKFNRKRALFNSNIWSISPDVKNKFPAPFPQQLVENCVLSCTDENDVVYDPFMGSGTTALVAKLNNRNFIGSELGFEYCEMVKNRIYEQTRDSKDM